MRRDSAVMGQFYPADLASLKEMMSSWKSNKVVPNCRVVIVPHAGYIFSGESAWLSLSMIDWQVLKRVVVIGPSHRVSFNGLSISLATEFQTVGGYQKMDREFALDLAERESIQTIEQAHFEHSTEVQIPLIRLLAKDLPVVEVVYGDMATKPLVKLISNLLLDKVTGVIISTDLSHYLSEAEAHKIDLNIQDGLSNLDLEKLKLGDACGKAGLEALVTVCKQNGHKISVVDYRTSADSLYGDKERVVGYLSGVVID